MAKKLKFLTVGFFLPFILGSLLLPASSYADSCPSGQATNSDTGKCAPIKMASDCPVGVDPNDPTKCTPLGNGCNNQTEQNCLKNDPIVTDLNTIVDALSAGVGIVVTIVIILGGIQYTLAGDNPQALTAARQKIINGLIALFVFLFIFTFLEWLIPGGVFFK